MCRYVDDITADYDESLKKLPDSIEDGCSSISESFLVDTKVDFFLTGFENGTIQKQSVHQESIDSCLKRYSEFISEQSSLNSSHLAGVHENYDFYYVLRQAFDFDLEESCVTDVSNLQSSSFQKGSI